MVEGANLQKYHKRANNPYISSIPAEIYLAPPQSNLNPLQPIEEKPIVESPTRTVAVQTMYRESDAQTDPYTPDFVVQPGVSPEILTLSNLYWGHGLPAGQVELEMMQHQKEVREYNAVLPPHTDEASFEIRKRLMEEQEMNEWQRREKEIDDLQKERLDLLQEAVIVRDQEQMAFQEERVDALRQRKLEEKETKVADIQRRRILALRKLAKAKKYIEPKKERRDIINDYTSFGSNTYAPITRLGLYPDDHPRDYDVFTNDLGKIEGITDLISSIPQRTLNLSVSKPTKTRPLKREERIVHTELEKMNDILIAKKEKEIKKPYVLPEWRRPKEKIIRPPTPTLEEEEDQEFENAVLLLQRLIRGRAIQNLMFDGKEKRLALIKELRSDEYLRDMSEELEQQTLEQQEKSKRDHMTESVVAAASGEVIAGTVDFLSKELIRVREQRRIKALIKKAEEKRRVREAEEGGRRQAELEIRSRKQEIYRTIIKVNQTTVKTLSDSLFDKVVEEAAINKALEKVNHKKYALNPSIVKLEEEINPPVVLVRDLVASFLMPEVERQRVANLVKEEQAKYIKAAHETIISAEKYISDYREPPPPGVLPIISDPKMSYINGIKENLKEEEFGCSSSSENDSEDSTPRKSIVIETQGEVEERRTDELEESIVIGGNGDNDNGDDGEIATLQQSIKLSTMGEVENTETDKLEESEVIEPPNES